MPSYRFCRSDDIPLLVHAWETCVRPHDPADSMTVERFKHAVRDLDLWTSGCMVALEGDDPIAVLIAGKRTSEACVYRIGVRPDRQRQGHARHLLTSIGSKLAILGPRRIVAEVPEGLHAVRALFERCGYRQETEFGDFTLPPSGVTGGGEELVVPVTLDELVASGAFDREARRSWARGSERLLRRKEQLRGLAVAPGDRIEAYVLYETEGDARALVALGCAEPARRELWVGLLCRKLLSEDAHPLGAVRLSAAEVPFDALRSLGWIGDGAHGWLCRRALKAPLAQGSG